MSTYDIFLIWCVLTGKKVDLGHIICNHMLHSIKASRASLPYGSHLAKLFEMHGLKQKETPVNIASRKKKKETSDLIGQTSLRMMNYEWIDGKWVAVSGEGRGLPRGRRGSHEEAAQVAEAETEEATKEVNSLKSYSEKETTQVDDSKEDTVGQSEDEENDDHAEETEATVKTTMPLTYLDEKMKDLEAHVSKSMEGIKECVRASVDTLEQKMKEWVKSSLDTFEGKFVSNLVQNYCIINSRVAKIEAQLSSLGENLSGSLDRLAGEIEKAKVPMEGLKEASKTDF